MSTPLQTFLTPGETALRLLFLFLDIPPEALNDDLVRVFAGFISFLFWLCVLRFVVNLAARILGFEHRGRQ